MRRTRKRVLVTKFFADRGTHLAAMIAYFALLSFVPLLFLALAMLGFAGQADQDSFFVKELHKIFPGQSLDSLLSAVRAIQENATTLGLVGAAALLWSSLSLFSVLESAFNIVYDRPNRSFLHGKALASLLMIGSVVTLFVSLVVGSVGVEAMKHYAPGFTANTVVAVTVSVLVSLWGVFVFLVSVYYVLTNQRLTVRDVIPGAVTAAILLEGTFQLLPGYLRLSKELPALQATGGPVILLVWLYVMANVIVFGAEVNWWFAQRRAPAPEEPAAGLA
jgi:membrane protein